MQTQTTRQQLAPNGKDLKELAYLYDLYVVPLWREVFDRMVDEEAEIPPDVLKEGVFLDAECGTGTYAIDLLVRAGKDAVVVGVDASLEKLSLARGKASVQHVPEQRLLFRQGSLSALGVAAEGFDWIIADASLTPASEIAAILAELHRVAKKGATIVLKLVTRGSFDEFFSVVWETLYDLDLIEFTPQLEALITERLTLTNVEEQAAAVPLKNIRTVNHKESFSFADGATFLTSPLIETTFLSEWLAFLPDAVTRERVKQHLPTVIDRARQALDFDVSIKATLLIAQK